MQTIQIFYIFLVLIVGEFIVSKWIWYLNTKNWSNDVPQELLSIYDQSKYSMSQKYEKEKYTFGLFTSIFSFFIIILAVVTWFFWYLDSLIRLYFQNTYAITLFFFGTLIFIQSIINLPFDYYSTFRIEERYGFNTSSKKLFFTDLFKSLLLTCVIGWLLLTAILWIYTLTQDTFWVYAWILLSLFSIFMMMFYSHIIVPLFNKQVPLEDGELKNAIKMFAQKVWFEIDNIYVIDGSKRSSKANAYFTWLWKKKRIVLFDTLIKDLSVDEIVAVLAHEIGHYKKKHTLQMLLFSIIQTWFVLYVLSLTLKIPEVSYALWATQSSFHIWVIAFSILFTPLSMFLWILANMLSRKNEYEADEFASKNFGAEKLQNALKKLSVNNLTNLRPHPVYEFVHYSHPTVLKRLQAMEKFKN